MIDTTIETQRLMIKALTCDELKMYADSTTELARVLRLEFPPRELEPLVREAIEKDLLPNLNDTMKEAIYYTLWVVIEKTQKKVAASFCFHGSPDEHGEIEIGYGTDADFQNQGIMSEAMHGLIGWLQKNTSIKIIRAETENNNISSLRLLEKSGFTRWGDNGSLSVWRLTIQG